MEIYREKVHAACVLHVRCMGRPIQITSLNWGNRKSVAGAKVLGGRGETLEAERLGPAINYMPMPGCSILICGVVTDYRSALFDNA